MSEWEEFFKKLQKRRRSSDDLSKDFEDNERKIEEEMNEIKEINEEEIVKKMYSNYSDSIRKKLDSCTHDWIQIGEAHKEGAGKFKKNFQCKKCEKIKTVDLSTRSYGGFSITIGPDKKPKIREFGNVKGKISVEVVRKVNQSNKRPGREPLVDVIESKNKIKIVAEIPGVSKKDINLDINVRQLKISTSSTKKYHKVINFSNYVDPSSAKAMYNNGILEITLLKKDDSRKDKKINIE